jgi:hypothetical protein
VFILKDYLKLVLLALIIKTFREVLPPAGKKIRLGPLRPRAILDLKVKFRKELRLACLPVV